MRSRIALQPGESGCRHRRHFAAKIDDVVVSQELPRLLQPPRQSFFLLGPRGSGKSTWIRQRFPKALRFDLLDEALYQELLLRLRGRSPTSG